MLTLHWIWLACAAFNCIMTGYVWARQTETAMNGKDYLMALFWSVTQLFFGFIIWPVLGVALLVVELAGYFNRLLSLSYIWKYVIWNQMPGAGLIKALEFAEKWQNAKLKKWSLKQRIEMILIRWSIKHWRAMIDSGKYNDHLNPKEGYES